MLELDLINGWMNYKNPNDSAKDRKNICPAFFANNYIRALDRENIPDRLDIVVNDHSCDSLFFTLSLPEIVDHKRLPIVLAENNFVCQPNYEKAISKHFIEEYHRCKADYKIEYRHHRLGWYKCDGTNHFLMDSNIVAGAISTCERKNFEFHKGNQTDYEKFLRNVVYPVPTLALAMAIGYSAPIVSLLRDEYDFGTIIYNLCGASSTGKSTVSQLLVSPFACPHITNQNGLIRTFSNTDNALFTGLNDIHGLPIVLDDSTTNQFINFSSLIYNLAQGENKGRCDVNGNLREQGSGWSGVVVISSETPIQSQSCHNQGLQARVIGTDGITWTPDAEVAGIIKNTIMQHYGWTGRDFAEFVASKPLIELKNKFQKALQLVNSMMIKRDKLSDRLALKYATIPMTLALMNEFFKLNLNVSKITNLLIEPEQRGVSDRDIAVKALDCIKQYVVEKRVRFKQLTYNKDGGRPIFTSNVGTDCYGKIIHRGKRSEVILHVKRFEEILTANGIYEYTTVKKRLKEQGLLKTDKDRYDIKVDGIRSIHILFPDDFCALNYDVVYEAETVNQQQPPIDTTNWNDNKLSNDFFVESRGAL